jgi:hypothetical protein
MVATIRWATAWTVFGIGSSKMTANSSPPSRATVSTSRRQPRFEVVQVQQHHDDQNPLPPPSGQGVIQALVQERPVRETGEAVLERHRT